MKDDIEKFIKDHREEMDGFEPSSSTWNELEKKLDRRNKKSVPGWIWKAAACIMIPLGIYLAVKHDSEKNIPRDNLSIINDIAPELAAAEKHYLQLIHQKKAELESYGQLDREVYESFDKEIAGLDSIYDQLRNELAEKQNREQLVSAMIQNLQIRMELLNQQMLILQSISKFKKSENHEKPV